MSSSPEYDTYVKYSEILRNMMFDRYNGNYDTINITLPQKHKIMEIIETTYMDSSKELYKDKEQQKKKLKTF
jgi:hypothetical protein